MSSLEDLPLSIQSKALVEGPGKMGRGGGIRHWVPYFSFMEMKVSKRGFFWNPKIMFRLDLLVTSLCKKSQLYVQTRLDKMQNKKY